MGLTKADDRETMWTKSQVHMEVKDEHMAKEGVNTYLG